MKTSEIALIRLLGRVGSAARNPQVRLAIGDDAALLRPRRGFEAILTCDWFLEGTHFLVNRHPPDSVGWKCLARGVSDIAAMGGEPKCFLLSLGIPKSRTGQWLNGFLKGLQQAANAFRCQLVGGDTTRHSSVLINVTAIGEVPAGRAALRSTARPGDMVFVSGTLGRAELGLRFLRRGTGSQLRNDVALKKHLYPEPRIALGRWLSSHGIASAMMDLSDGLSTDLTRLCTASHVGARIEAARIPVATLFRSRGSGRRGSQKNPLEFALNGGDDYELLFTVRPTKAHRVPAAFHGIRLSRIGAITSGRELILRLANGRETLLLARGWDPFRTGR